VVGWLRWTWDASVDVGDVGRGAWGVDGAFRYVSLRCSDLKGTLCGQALLGGRTRWWREREGGMVDVGLGRGVDWV